MYTFIVGVAVGVFITAFGIGLYAVIKDEKEHK